VYKLGHYGRSHFSVYFLLGSIIHTLAPLNTRGSVPAAWENSPAPLPCLSCPDLPAFAVHIYAIGLHIYAIQKRLAYYSYGTPNTFLSLTFNISFLDLPLNLPT
jgi:hypothetical protein